MHVKKNDNVIVTTGKDKGKTGKIVRALPKRDMVLVSGVNVRKVHERARRANQKGQIIERESPIHVSNVKKTEEAKPKQKKTTKKAETK